MKKILLFVLLFVSTISYSQTVIETYKNKLSRWNYRTEKWESEDYNYVGITFTFTENYLESDAKSKPKYYLISKGQSVEEINYKAIRFNDVEDDKGRKLNISLVTYTDDNSKVMIFMYEDIAFYFYLKTNGVSKF